jgi:hypothetical protein
MLFSSCDNKEDASPESTPMFSAQLNGKMWQASSCLVSREQATATEDAHLVIQPTSSGGNVRMLLYVYGVEKPGTYTMDKADNDRRYNCALEITGTPDGLSAFDGDGPANFTFTKVEKGHYEGTFSATFYDPARKQTMEITEGKFSVREGVQ